MAKKTPTPVDALPNVEVDVTSSTLQEAAIEHASAALSYRTAQRDANAAVKRMQEARARLEATSKRYQTLTRKVTA